MTLHWNYKKDITDYETRNSNLQTIISDKKIILGEVLSNFTFGFL